MIDFRVRPATMRDYDGLCVLYEELDWLHHVQLPHVFNPPSRPSRPRDFISGLIDAHDQAVFVAEEGENGTIMGLVVTHLREFSGPIVVSKTIGWVEDSIVAKSHRRQGVGTALVEHAHTWFESAGVDEVRLVVWSFKGSAETFYGHLGYLPGNRMMRLKLR